MIIFFLQDDTELMCKMFGGSLEQTCKPSFTQCCFCGGPRNSFKMISSEIDSIHGSTGYHDIHIDERKKVEFLARFDLCNYDINM